MAVPRKTDLAPDLRVVDEAPLIAVFFNIDGEEVVRYFTSEEEADAAITPEMRAESLAAIGAWSDLDLDELLDDLDRIRHSSPPTPPIEFDDES
jgi:hypothetical protein